MDKKKLNTVLIVAVACIWGVLLYKFIAPYFGESETEYMVEIPTEIPLIKVKKKDTFDLSFPDRDPFLGKTTRPKIKIIRPKKVIAKRTAKNVKPILWPKIQYLGFVRSSSNKGRLGLVRIDGKLHRVKNGEMVAGVKIKKITGEALIILNGKEERSFNRK